MAHFYASIKGARGEATRMGTPNSGIRGHIRGWDLGALVRCYVGIDGNDYVEVTITGGSNNTVRSELLGVWGIRDGKLQKVNT